MELDHSGFSTQGATIYAGNIGNNAYILQVSAMGVRLLQGGLAYFYYLRYLEVCNVTI